MPRKPPLERADQEYQVSIRLQPGTKERADALAKSYAEDPAMAKFGPWNRHRILRVAVETGLDILEDKIGDGSRKLKR